MTNKEIAKQILENVGGASNVTFLTHCVTRLRFSLKNEGKANTDKLEALEGVLGVQKQGGQFQVIVGGKVNKLYADLSEMLHQLVITSSLDQRLTSTIRIGLENNSGVVMVFA